MYDYYQPEQTNPVSTFFFWWFCSAVICSVIGAFLASRRNLPTAAGVVLGLVLGVIGVALIAFLYPLHQCPECKSVLNTGAIRCKRCGVLINES